MKILIIGRGVTGTFYGWALSESGEDVTHVVRRDGLPSSVKLDLLDLRPGRSKWSVVSYTPKTVRVIHPTDAFDLVIVATKHYQAIEAIRQYRPCVPNATFLMFTANWDGTEEIDRLIPRSALLWFYPSASGGHDERGIFNVTVSPSVRFGILHGSNPAKGAEVTQLFQKAGFTLDIKPDMVHWLWIHHAINAAGIGVGLWAGGIDQAVRSPNTIRLGVLAAREALQVVAARGVDLEQYPDAREVLKTAPWAAALATMFSVKFTRKGRRLLKASHFSRSPDEMKHFYFDVLETGERLGVPMPHLSALRDRIECFPAQTSN